MKKQPKTIRKRTKRSNPPKDLTGKRFGKWVVLKYAGEKVNHRLWLCRCDCGRAFTPEGTDNYQKALKKMKKAEAHWEAKK
jgi:hypothetical protein